MRVVKETQITRRTNEPARRRDGYVPLLPRDAVASWYADLLPECAVEVTVRGMQHGRLVWAHPGPSGLDPRAVAPLALVLMADEGVDLVQAAQLLLTEDLNEWLARPTHRVYASRAGETCLVESAGRSRPGCVTHLVADRQAQRVAEALGDTSYATCVLRFSEPSDPTWTGAQRSRDRGMPPDLPQAALAVTHRYARWVARNYSGSLAWDLARHAVSLRSLKTWRAAGFSDAEIANYLVVDDLFKRPLRHTTDPVLLDLSTPRVAEPESRGLHWYAQWKMAGKQSLVLCRLCGAKDHASPCRTCQQDGGPAGRVAWNRYEPLLVNHPTAGGPRPVGPVPCGEPSCQTFLAASGPSPKGAQQ